MRDHDVRAAGCRPGAPDSLLFDVVPAFLIPAVSMTLTGMPSIRICCSMVSLVVPGRGETMARSTSASRFSRLDFPALGLPMIAIFRPSASSLPVSARAEISARH